MKKYTKSSLVSKVKLEQVVKSLESSATRDRNELSKLNVKESTLIELRTKHDAIRTMKSDTDYKIELYSASEAKNKLAVINQCLLRDVTNKVGLAYGTDSPVYRQLAVNRLRKATPTELLIIGEEVVRILTPVLQVLADYDITAQVLEQVAQNRNELQKALRTVEEIEQERSVKAYERNGLQNELIGIIKRISKAGKVAWYNVDMSKYHDYVLKLYKKSSQQTESENVEEEATA